jgi:hypothetical protein
MPCGPEVGFGDAERLYSEVMTADWNNAMDAITKLKTAIQITTAIFPFKLFAPLKHPFLLHQQGSYLLVDVARDGAVGSIGYNVSLFTPVLAPDG